MGKLKVGFVLDDTLDTPDGVQQYILTLGTWLKEQGHDVHYLVGHTTRKDIPNVHSMSKNIRVQFNGNRMSTPMPANKQQVRALLEKEKFDILHVQIPYSPFLAHKIILTAPKTTAIIGTFHIAPSSSLVTMANKVLGTLNKRSLQRFDALLSVSPAAANFARVTHGIDTSVLPNVVKADYYRNATPFSPVTNTKTIVFLGRLVPRKGCQILLEALEILKADASIPKLRVIVCGKGPLDAVLKAYTKSHGLDEQVEFAGFVDEETKARYLKTADIAVFPSTGGESFGIVLLEAMAADHPVVLGADNDGYKTVLAPSPDQLFPARNAAALAVKLRQYLTSEADTSNALAWQRRYLPAFDVAVVGQRLVSRYREALRSRQSS
ncbi:MAG: hypothetical protein JWP13_329 [Candidatus Saccharibacteria bacterium]|nr:hypothetical protein [Candidatus Saccharibacteria bacterium]